MRRLACTLIILLAFPIAAACVELSVKPQEALRALHKLRDKIAQGDKAALLLQKELLGTLNDSVAGVLVNSPKELDLVFAVDFLLSGGSREFIKPLQNLTGGQAGNTDLLLAAISYAKGDTDAARAQLEPIDPYTLDARLGPLVALAKGNLDMEANSALALKAFNKAKLLAPGTLVEEVALRKIIVINGGSDDADAFLNSSSEYLRRFSRSPYADQFMPQLIAGVVKLNPQISSSKVAVLLNQTSIDKRASLYSTLARQALISGKPEWASFAVEEALKEGSFGKHDQLIARMKLYKVLSSVTKVDEEALQQLVGALDLAKLPNEDRQLLDAALSTARAISRPITATPGVDSLQVAPAKVAEDAVIKAPDSSRNLGHEPAQNAPYEDTITRAKSSLSSIDKLLQEAP